MSTNTTGTPTPPAEHYPPGGQWAPAGSEYHVPEHLRDRYATVDVTGPIRDYFTQGGYEALVTGEGTPGWRHERVQDEDGRMVTAAVRDGVTSSTISYKGPDDLPKFVHMTRLQAAARAHQNEQRMRQWKASGWSAPRCAVCGAAAPPVWRHPLHYAGNPPAVCDQCWPVLVDVDRRRHADQQLDDGRTRRDAAEQLLDRLTRTTTPAGAG